METKALEELERSERADAALRESEERFRVLFEHSPDGIFLIDPHHPDGMWRLVDCNEVACRMNGYTREELVGQPIGILDVGPKIPGGDRLFLERLRREGTIQEETEHRRKDGTIFPVEYSICFITVDGEDLVLGIDRDITERKRAEAERFALERELIETQKRTQLEAVIHQNEMLLEVDRMKSEFIANVSHELRNPLNHIKGYTSILLQRGASLEPQTTQEFLQTILEAGEKLAGLVNDLIDTSRIETGVFSIHYEPVQLDELLHNVVHRWQEISTHRFAVETPAEVPAVAADRGRIEQVLDNMLANVAQHTPERTEAVVGLEVAADEMVVSVRDHGPGVAAHQLAHLFDRFYQAGSQTSGRKGSGLGLFICRGIVEQHGGRIWAEPTPGSGTTIRFTVPR